MFVLLIRSGETARSVSQEPLPRKAVASAQIVNGFVVAITISDGGLGYDAPPFVILSGGHGSGAAAVASVSNGMITNISITDSGRDYTSDPDVNIASPLFDPRLSIDLRKVFLATGTVVAWGYNGEGETNVLARLSCVTAIAIGSGSEYTLVLKSDGTVVAWGDNNYGQTTLPNDLGPVKTIAAGEIHSVALKANGTGVAWGWNFDGQTTVPEGLSGVTAVAAGSEHTVALKNDGTVVAWGRQRLRPNDRSWRFERRNGNRSRV